MTVDTQRPGATPSLQTLLSLEQHYTSFDEQLLHAARIVGLQESLTSAEDSLGRPIFSKQRFHSRSEWVLRWLLDKLKTQDDVGRTARSSTRAWTILSELLHAVPIPNAAKLLSGCQFLSVLEQALLENFTVDAKQTWTTNGAIQDTSDLVGQESTPGSSATSEEQPRPSKKRKRQDELLKESVTAKPTIRPIASVMKLFGSITVVVETIDELSSPSNEGDEGAVAFAQMRAVLRTDTPQAANILKLWILALNSIIRSFAQAQRGPDSWKGRALRLSPASHIWEMRSLSPDDESGTSAPAFSTECLVPATQLLSAITHRFESIKDQHVPRFDLEESVRQLEQLLARHAFVPSRTAFFASREDKKSTTHSARRTSSDETLRELLQPLKSHLEAGVVEDISRFTRSRDLNETSFGAIPLLLDIAIRCSPNLTIKRKHTEMSWINDVFTVLMECACSANREPSGSVQKQMQSRALEELLDIITKRKLSLNEETLKTIVREYGKVFGATQDIRWNLISKAVALDPDIFIDQPRSSKTDRTGPWASTLSTGLGDAVSRLEPPSDFEEPPEGSPWKIATESIIIPLMQAYARSRNLTGFFGIWEVQLEHQLSVWLSDIEEQNISKSPPNRRLRPNIWEDPDVIKALRPLLETSLSSKQIAEELDDLLAPIQELRESIEEDDSIGDDGESSISESSGPYPLRPRKPLLDTLPTGQRHIMSSAAASHVVLDAVLGALHSDRLIEELLPQLQSLFTELSAIATEERVNPCELLPGIWRLLSRLQELMLPFLDHSALTTQREKLWHPEAHLSQVAAALESFRDPPISEERYDGIAMYAVAIRTNAFAFVINAIHGFATDSDSRVRATEALEAAISTLFGHEWVPWGRGFYRSIQIEDSDDAKYYSNEAVFRLDLACNFVRFPDVLQYLPSERRREVFRVLFWCALADRSVWYILEPHETGPCTTSALVFDALIDIICIAASSTIRDDLFQVLLEGLSGQDDSEEDQDLHRNMISFSEHCVHRIPLAAMGRKYREAVLDKLLEIVKSTTSKHRPTELAQHLSLMLKFMEVPNATAQLCVDPEALVLLASSLSNEDVAEEPSLVELLQALVRQTLQHIAATKEQERSQQYLDSLRIRLLSYIDNNGFPTGRPGMAVLLNQIFSLLVSGDKTQPLGKDVIRRYRAALEARLNELDHIRESGKPFVKHELEALLLGLIQLLGVTADQRSLPDSMETAWQKFAKMAQPASADDREFDFEDSTWVLVHQLAGTRRLEDHLESYVGLTLSLLRRDLSARDYRKLLRNFEAALQQVNVEQQSLVVTILQPSEDQQIPSPESLELLHTVTQLSKRPVPKISGDTAKNLEAAPAPLDGSFTIYLCAHFAKVPDIRRFHLLADCITTVIQEKAWLITQYAIDTLLASLAVLSSPSAPALPTAHAGVIYHRLCSITHTLISLHRTKLGGRFHILIPLLQALLGCLYIPETPHSTGLPLPPWLSTSKPLLNQKHATTYARLLTTFCSPTVSSVSRKRKRGDIALTDETKKARQYAGQYVPLVLMQYCSLQLRGRVAEGVRERLQPGLWAAMDVVGIEGMRAMSAGMDAPARAVWRGVYGEWNRFGRWKER